MSLADQVKGAYLQDGNRCSVKEQLDALAPKQRAELEEFLAGSVPSSVLLRACQAEGYEIITRSGIYRHRQNKCLCKGRK